MSHPVRRVVAAFAAFALLGSLVACVPAGESGDGPVFGVGQPFSDDQVDVLAELFEGAGIHVVDTPTPAAIGSEDIVVVTRDQLVSMTAEVVVGAGSTGFDLDAITGLVADPLPFSFLLAGWASEWDGEGARVARMLLGERDWTAPQYIVWPMATLALFVADITADNDPAGPPAAIGPMAGGASRSAGDICTAAKTFLSVGINTIFVNIEAAAVAAEKGGIFGKIVAIGIRAFAAVVQGVVDAVGEITSAILAPIKQAVAVAATLQVIASFITPWHIRITADPSPLQQEGQPATTRITANVESRNGLPDYPDVVKHCADLAGLTLPKPPATGAGVTWSNSGNPGYLVSLSTEPGRVTDNGTVSNTLTLAPSGNAPDGDRHDGVSTVTVQIKQDPTAQLVDLAHRLVNDALSGLLGPLAGIVRPYAQGIVDRALGVLSEHIGRDLRQSLDVPFVYYTKKDDPPPASAPEPADFTLFCSLWIEYYQLTIASPETHFLSNSQLVAEKQTAMYAASPEAIAPDTGYLLLFAANNPYSGGELTAESARLHGQAVGEWGKANCPPPLNEDVVWMIYAGDFGYPED